MAIEEARTVATLLGSQREGTNKSPAYVYDDEKLSVVFDSGADQLTVVLKFPNGRETVLNTVSGGTPIIFRQGKLIQYLTGKLKHVKDNFSPIDDSQLFG